MCQPLHRIIILTHCVFVSQMICMRAAIFKMHKCKQLKKPLRYEVNLRFKVDVTVLFVPVASVTAYQ